jgi:lactoylglutathione lyase
MKIEHIAIWVNDLERMKQFYENYFGAVAGKKYHNPSNNFTSYFLSFAHGARMEIMHRPDILRKNLSHESLGFTHLALSLGSKEKVDLLTEELHDDGYEVVGYPRTTGDGYYESVVKDPEGNMLELTV